MGGQLSISVNDSLVVKKQRSRPRPVSSQKLSNSRSMGLLSPTREESRADLIDLDSPRDSPQDYSGCKQSPKPPAPPASQTSKSATASVVKRKPCPKLIGDLLPKSADSKTDFRQQQFRIQDATPPAPLSDLSNNKWPATVQLQTSSVWRPFSTDHKTSNSPSNLTVSLHVRRLATSEPGTAHSLKSTDRIMSGKYENSRSKLAQTEGGLPTTLSTDHVHHHHHHPRSTAVAHVVSVKPSPNYSIRSRATEEEDSREDSIITSNNHARKATPAPIEFKLSPMSRLKAFTASKGKQSTSILLGTDGPATNTKRDSVLKRVFKSESPAIGSSHTTDQNTEHREKKRQKLHAPTATVSGSPRVSVKDLAARFDTAATNSLNAPSPRKSPVKNSFDDFRALSEPPKNGVISPYTSNPPSPTKSQRSGKSDKSIRSIRGPLSLQDPQSSVSKPPTPRRLIRTSTPLHATGKPVEEAIPPIPDGSNGQQQTDKPYLRKYSSLNFSVPRALQSPTKSAALQDTTKELRTFDGHESATQSSTIILGPSSSLPVSSNVHFASPQPLASRHSPISRSPPQKNTISSNEGRRSLIPNPIPSRSNSILHSQVRTLQRQLEAKTDEIRQLKQLLENQGVLDIGSISEQLQEAKREVICWKTRAEIAEKQTELMGKLPLKGRASTTRIISGAVDKRATKMNQQGQVPVQKIQNALAMTDGAASPRRESSLESSDTILHDLTATEREFGMWADHISMGINSNSLSQAFPHSPKLLLDFGRSEET